MTDRHIQLTAFPDGLPVAARPPVWLGASLGYARRTVGSSIYGLGARRIRRGPWRTAPLFAVDRRRHHATAGAHHPVGAPRQRGDLAARSNERQESCFCRKPVWICASHSSPGGRPVTRLVALQECEPAMGAQHSVLCRIVRHGHARHSIADEDLDAGPVRRDGHGRLRRSLGIRFSICGWASARARGTFFNPNFFAAYESAVVLLSLGVLLFTRWNTLPASFRSWLWVCGGCLIGGRS